MPKISVIMPIYNAQKYITKTVESILGQDYSDFELIMVDDNPTDDTMDVLSTINDERIRLIHNEHNMGIAQSRNNGLAVANGEYIALMDDDDLCPNDRFSFENTYLDEHPEIDVIGGGYRVIDKDSVFVTETTPMIIDPDEIRVQFMFYCPMYNGSTMYRRRIIEDYGLRYLDGFLGMEDYRFWVEASLHSRMTNTERALLYWRQVATTETMRVLEHKLDARERKFAEIQKFYILSSGFDLSEEELDLFTGAFREAGPFDIPQENLDDVLCLLDKMSEQAVELPLYNSEVVKRVFGQRFSGLMAKVNK
ncbi:Glycosyltransferase involved in cell wall bisynthesis [Lachnospiraceae bacterium XBB2008]|nr:Glycosyltransferase involved in cell wall bisynthesis [Lachnospiraceae bacterium XBB2008]